MCLKKSTVDITIEIGVKIINKRGKVMSTVDKCGKKIN